MFLLGDQVTGQCAGGRWWRQGQAEVSPHHQLLGIPSACSPHPPLAVSTAVRHQLGVGLLRSSWPRRCVLAIPVGSMGVAAVDLGLAAWRGRPVRSA